MEGEWRREWRNVQVFHSNVIKSLTFLVAHTPDRFWWDNTQTRHKITNSVDFPVE